MTTKAKHRITNKVAACDTTLSRTSTEAELKDCIRIGRQLVTDASQTALLLRNSKVLKSNKVPVLTKHATTLSAELKLLSSSLTSAENDISQAATLSTDEDEVFMMKSLAIGSDIMDATERFVARGVKAAGKIESISKHVIEGK